MSDPKTPSSGDSGIMNYALRMVIPIKREFGRSLDVQHFLHDLSYAKEVLEEARQSQNPKLREYVEYLETRMMGPRNAAPPAPAVTQRLQTQAAPPASSDQKTELSLEEEAKRLMLAKYRSGLR
ncbi:MAG: hypothetical protein MUF44_03285 [Hydrogenophaga sp.]|jgi:hypothetical protein|nr:hypothetical protein [Hydrogenophaga sp.]